ncbi:T9SS type A sorting domain-containing protein [Flavobacterium sp.]|uniref:fibronectin type III domain-containing protein n=1 Tax=Flavobacterium sp. TaxID=239 RepID=UPI00261ECB78|nr:T9SS type A sorting domain-containing protein [Flavobacterium sp.]
MMKKITKLLSDKKIMVLFALFLSVLSYGQCVNPTQFGSVVSNNSGTPQIITTCAYSSEYNNVTGLVVGENYIFTAQLGFDTTGPHRYVSITDVNNVSIAHGPSPLVVNAITASAIRLHVSDNATCGQTSTCHTTTVQFLADCPAPITLGANSITTSGANVTWTPVGTETLWDIEYGIQGFTPGTGTLITNVSATNYTLSGLNSGTNYQFYVRAKCSTEDSLWSTPFSFPTVCASVTEFYENFDTTTASFGGALPICWAKGGSAANVYLQNGSGIPMSAPNRMYMFANGDTPIETYASMPLISNLQANTHRLRFSAYATTADRTLYLGYLTDPNDVGTFQYLDEFVMPTGGVAAATQFILTPGALPVGVQRLVFRNIASPAETSTIYIDDVRWEPIPTCTEPSNVVTTNVLATTTTVEWNAPSTAPANGYEYYLSTSNTVPTAATVATGSVGAGITTVGLTSLTPVTQYYIWVRSVCSTSSKSVWTLTSTFTTPCASYVPYYLEDFSTFTFAVQPNCWKRFSDGDLATGPTGTDNSGSWVPTNMMNGTGNTAARINLYSTFPKGWLVSPIFDLSAGGYQVKYNVGTTDYFNTNPIETPGVMGSDDVVQFLMSTDGGVTWAPLETYDSSNTPGNTVATEIYDIPAVTSNAVKFAYYANAGSAADTTDYDFFIDNFIVQTIPTTVPACASNVVATINASCGNFPTVLSWSATSGSDGYKLSIGTTPGGTDILNSQVLTALNYSYTGSINTTYYYKVVPYNNNGDAVACAEQSFTTSATGCYCTSVPSSNDGNGITNVQLGTTNFPTTDVVYFDHSATTVTMSQGVSNNVQITFATGYTYDTNIWIDFNNDFDFNDAGELVQTGIASTNANPTTLNASFVMPASAALGVHKMRIGTSDFGQVPPNTCYSGAYGVTLDFSVNIVVAGCTPAAVASSTITPNCASSQFSVAVDVTSLGSGSPSISDGTTTIPVTATGVVNVGPYANGTSVVLTLLHGSDSVCNVSLGTFTYSCPPANDNCAGAIALTAGGTFATNPLVVSNSAATNSNPPTPGCAFFQGGDVWYSVVVPASGNITVETNPNGTSPITDTGLAVYSGACASLTLVQCDDDSSTSGNFSKISLTGRTPGEVLYVNVWEYGNDAVGTFQVSAYDASLGNGSFDSSNFTFYPNPVKDVLNLSYSQNINKVQVINILGQEVKTETMDTNQVQVDMSNFPIGTYLVKITSGNDVKTIKVVKE